MYCPQEVDEHTSFSSIIAKSAWYLAIIMHWSTWDTQTEKSPLTYYLPFNVPSLRKYLNIIVHSFIETDRSSRDEVTYLLGLLLFMKHFVRGLWLPFYCRSQLHEGFIFYLDVVIQFDDVFFFRHVLLWKYKKDAKQPILPECMRRSSSVGRLFYLFFIYFSFK